MGTKLEVAPFFIAEHRALDLLNSVCAPWGEELDWLMDGEEFVNWLKQATLVSEQEANWVSEHFSRAELDEVAQAARALRERFRKVVIESAQAQSNQALIPEIEMINDILKRSSQYPQLRLQQDNGDIALHSYHRWQQAEDLLHPIALCIGEYLCDVDFSKIKNCEGPTCTLWFWDTSKNNKRRWCSMSICGNRAKAAAHRARKK